MCPTGIGSQKVRTGRHEPAEGEEAAALADLLKNPLPGTRPGLELTRLGKTRPEPGWVKLREAIRGIKMHYVYNPEMNAVGDFKFKE